MALKTVKILTLCPAASTQNVISYPAVSCSSDGAGLMPAGAVALDFVVQMSIVAYFVDCDCDVDSLLGYVDVGGGDFSCYYFGC